MGPNAGRDASREETSETREKEDDSELLEDSEDAYGHQLYDFFKGENVVELVERDDGLLDPSESLPKYYLSEYRDWTQREKQASRYVKGRVLDIGSGGGRWSLYLQRKGHDVLAIDNSPLAIKVCRLRGVRNAQVVPISDVSPKMGKFDTILMIGNNFGLFGGPKRARRLLRVFHKITSPDARIIAESNDVYKKPISQVHKEYHQLNRRRGRMPGQVRIRVRYLKFASPWFDYLMVSRPEMKQIVEGTGWRIKRFILSKESPAYIAIMEKTA